MGSSKTRFGQSLDGIMRSHGYSQTRLAQEIGSSAAYVSAVRLGKKSMSPGKISDWSEKIGLTEEEEVSLHRAAAEDAGFKLDLPDDF